MRERVFRFLVVLFAGLAAFLLYSGSLGHDFAQDDVMVIKENPAVQQGARGISDILTSDSWDMSLTPEEIDPAAGGRYRPLSLVTFALEIEALNRLHPEEPQPVLSPRLGHWVNGLLYALTVMLVVCFAERWFFPGRLSVALLAGLFFAAHPLHVEVVANIKSRDEILALLFALLAFGLAVRHARVGGSLNLLLLFLCCFLALLAKEFALLLPILGPMLVWLLHKHEGWTRRLTEITLSIGFAVAVYLAVRMSMIPMGLGQESTDILNNPWVQAESGQLLPTKLAVLGKYLVYCIWPYHHSCSWHFAEIPYRNWRDPLVWMSLLAFCGIAAAAFLLLLRRHILAFPLFLFLGTLFMVSNLVINLGTMFGERMAYQASFGFVMVSIALVFRWTRRPQLLWLLLFPLLVAAGFRTVDRVRDWKNDKTLFLADAHSDTQSILINANVGTYLYEEGKYAEALPYLDRAAAIAPREFILPLETRLLCRLNLGNFEGTVDDFRALNKVLYPEDLAPYRVFLGQRLLVAGMQSARLKQLDVAVRQLEAAVEVDPSPEAKYLLSKGLEAVGRAEEADSFLRESVQELETLRSYQWPGFKAYRLAFE